MPELPEVETIRSSLEPYLIGNRVKAVIKYSEVLRKKLPESFNAILNSVIQEVRRRCRYIIITFANGICMIVHFGMTGKLSLVQEKYTRSKHDHVVFFFEKFQLIYNDPRKFGLIDVIPANILDRIYLKNLGPEPLSEGFNPGYLKNILKNKKSPIKTLLINSKIVAGVGNIYANEILYAASIHPLKIGASLSEQEILNLVAATKDIISKAIAFKGTTLKDYRTIDDTKGSFQNLLQIYNSSQNARCFKCSFPIAKIKISGRSTYYCSLCQK